MTLVDRRGDILWAYWGLEGTSRGLDIMDSKGVWVNVGEVNAVNNMGLHVQFCTLNLGCYGTDE